MRNVRFATVVILSFLTSAGLSAGEKGNFTISFTKRSPLSEIETIKARLGNRMIQLELAERRDAPYDLSKELFEVYVPTDNQPGTRYGLVVWIHPQGSGRIRESYKPVMDEHHLIWIAPSKSGNNLPLWHRIAPAIDAAHNMKKRYDIDPARVYVGGFRDGARSASFLAVAYPELFHGGFYLHGGYYFRKIAVPTEPGRYFYHFQTPPPNTLKLIKQRNRYVLLSGDHDLHRKAEILVKATYEAYKRGGFSHVAYIKIPGMRRGYPNPAWFGKCIAFLEHPSQLTGTIEDNVHNEPAQPSLLANRRSPFAQRDRRRTFLAETERLLSPKKVRQVDGVAAKPTQPTSPSTPQLREREVEELRLSPGMQVRIDAPEAKSYFLVYVPSDYTPVRPWPVIFCYHGYSGSATTWPFRQVTGGKGFIIVGMNYATTDYHKQLPYEKTGPEKAYFNEAFAFILSHLRIEPKFVFMGGYSQGGYSTTVLGEQMLERLAGRLVLGAGRTHVDRFPPPTDLIRGHPVFFGAGELDDPHYLRAKRAAQLYREWGADVTFEGWPDETHGLSNKWQEKTKMLDWLIAKGPLKQAESMFSQALVAENEGKLGQAFSMYDQASRILPDNELCNEATTSAERLFQDAHAQLAEAEKAMNGKPYRQAAAQLNQIAETYQGSVFAELAQKHLKDLLNTKADELEGKAHAAEETENYKKSLQFYQLYLGYFSGSERYQIVKARMNALKAQMKVKEK